jgi:broad specificity phosphatase PhoE
MDMLMWPRVVRIPLLAATPFQRIAMPAVHFITHPEVTIDPTVLVPDWPLSATGLRRVERLLERSWILAVRTVFSSGERKAADMARMMADCLGLSPVILAGLEENDRSSTGYLPKAEFETVADAFFARPDASVRGWERAGDAQRRVVMAVDDALAMVSADGDVAIISHGGVGALLLCHLKGVPISRAEDQPGHGGGNAFSFDAATRRLLTGWRSIET